MNYSTIKCVYWLIVQEIAIQKYASKIKSMEFGPKSFSGVIFIRAFLSIHQESSGFSPSPLLLNLLTLPQKHIH